MYKQRRPIPIDWDTYLHWMTTDPSFISRYTRRGSFVVDKETGEPIFVIICEKFKDYEKRGIEDVYER